MTIYSRFEALPRARKGTTTVVIVEESVLYELIADAQASEAGLFGARSAGPITSITGGADGGAPMQITVHHDPPPPPSADVIVESARRSRRRLGGASRGW